MEKIGIIVDAGADLPQNIIERNQILVVPVKMNWPEIENLPGENVFQKMREMEKQGIKGFGKTSQPSPKDFLDAYNLQLGKFEKVICITITSRLSGTNNSAVQARKFLGQENQEKIFIVDSLSASGGEALFVLEAIDLIKEGKTIEEITKEIEGLVSRIHTYIIFEDSKWVEASGRISHFVSSIIKGLAGAGIRPVLSFKEGELKPSGIKTNAKDIPTALFNQFKNEAQDFIKEGKKIRVIITHGDDLAGAQRLKKEIEKEFKNTEVVFLNIINNVVGVVAGPNVLTLAWYA